MPATDRLSNKIRIRALEPDDSLAHLTGMLHRAYKQHADRGIKALAAFQPEEVTRKRIAGGECYVALYLDKVVGTILFRGPGQLGGTPWFERGDVATFSQFAVEPEYQGRGIGGELMGLIEDRAIKSGATELALSTPEPAAWLVGMYERHGYRVVERVHWKETNYTSVIMSKALTAANLGGGGRTEWARAQSGGQSDHGRADDHDTPVTDCHGCVTCIMRRRCSATLAHMGAMLIQSRWGGRWRDDRTLNERPAMMIPSTAFCVSMLAGVAAAACSINTDPPTTPKAEPPAAPTSEPAPKREPSKFDELMVKVAAEYKAFPRVSDRANWAPAMCMIPPATGAQRSTSGDHKTHGRKLYFLYAKDSAAYDAMSSQGTLDFPGTKDPKVEKSAWINPVGQIVVKEAFRPVEVAAKDRPAFEKDTFGQAHLPREYVELDGKLHRTGDAAGLFIMLKLDPKTEGADEGWVYGVTSPDQKSVVESGRIASCIGCHEQTTRDRLYGHQWSWPRGKDGAANPPLKRDSAKPATADDIPSK